LFFFVGKTLVQHLNQKLVSTKKNTTSSITLWYMSQILCNAFFMAELKKNNYNNNIICNSWKFKKFDINKCSILPYLERTWLMDRGPCSLQKYPPNYILEYERRARVFIILSKISKKDLCGGKKYQDGILSAAITAARRTMRFEGSTT
jgi:hypothetical protein